MNLIDLKELVDEVIYFFGEEKAEFIEVRYASQPSYPLEYSIANDYVISENNNTVYLIEENQIGYLPKDIKDDIRLW